MSKDSKVVLAAVGLWLASALISLSAVAGIIYVAFHFIHKFW